MAGEAEEQVNSAQMNEDIFQKCYDWPIVKNALAADLYPYFIPITGEQGAEVVIKGKKMIMLGSNNYMGLANDARVKEAAREAILQYGAGCTGSRFLNGTLDIHIQLEEELASFMGKPAALAFSTGMQANLGGISALVGKDEVVITDRQNHASIFDGCRLSYGKVHKFAHNDPDDLERLLGNLPAKTRKMVVVDGVFSMEGTVPDLKRILALCKKNKIRLMVDEAHGIGVLGKNGRGACEEQGVLAEVDLVMGTFSKSLASIGGFLVADKPVIDWIKHKARAMIFSAALPPPAVATVLRCLEIIKKEPERRTRLMENASRLRNALKGCGLNVGTSQTPVIPVVVGENEQCFLFWKALFERGVFVNPVVSPATPPGRGLLRVSCMATHTPEMLDRAVEIFREAGKACGSLS